MRRFHKHLRLGVLIFGFLLVWANSLPSPEPVPPVIEFVTMQSVPDANTENFGWRATFRLTNRSRAPITYSGLATNHPRYEVVNATDPKSPAGFQPHWQFTYFLVACVLPAGQSVEFQGYIRDPNKPFRARVEYWNGQDRRLKLPSWIPVTLYDWYEQTVTLGKPLTVESLPITVKRPLATYETIRLPPEPGDDTNIVERFGMRTVFR